MTVAQLRNTAEASPVIRVAIVCGPETAVLAGSLETLLAEAKGRAADFRKAIRAGGFPNFKKEMV